MEQGQVPAKCGHDADAFILVAEAGVDVHAPDEQPPHGFLVCDFKFLIALLWCGRLC